MASKQALKDILSTREVLEQAASALRESHHPLEPDLVAELHRIVKLGRTSGLRNRAAQLYIEAKDRLEAYGLPE